MDEQVDINPPAGLLTATDAPPQVEHPHILIAGLGNLLMKDDGVGVHVVRRIAAKPIPGAVAVEIGTSVLDAVRWLEWADMVIAIDAIQAGGSPGTVYRLENPTEAGANADGAMASVHDIKLSGALALLPTDTHPRRIIAIGVEPAAITHSLEISPVVKEAVPEVIRAAKQVVAGSATTLRGQGPHAD